MHLFIYFLIFHLNIREDTTLSIIKTNTTVDMKKKFLGRYTIKSHKLQKQMAQDAFGDAKYLHFHICVHEEGIVIEI